MNSRDRQWPPVAGLPLSDMVRQGVYCGGSEVGWVMSRRD